MPSLDFSQAWPWLQWVIAAAAVVAFLAGAIRGVPAAWRVVSTFVKTINALSDLPDELEKQAAFREKTEATLASQDKQIADIHHEVHYNNGSSVKDAIRRVELKLDGEEK